MIYFCIPAHNEEKTVGIVLWKLRQVMAAYPRDYLVLLADDASTDKSAEILDPYRRVLPLVILRTTQQRGFAATLEMLLREAVRRSKYPKRDVIIPIQADFSDDPDDVPELLRRIESGADIAAGGPVTDARKRPWLERLSRAWGRRSLNRFDWPDNVDPLNGFNAYRVSCIKRALEERSGRRLLAWDGEAANAALLHAALPHARRTDTVPITHHLERVQRPRRTARLELVRQLAHFAAGSESPGLIEPARLTPDHVHGDLAVLQEPALDGTERTNGAGRTRPQRKRHRDQPRQAAEPEQAPGQKPRPGRQRRAQQPRPTAGPAGAETTAGPRPPRRRSGRPRRRPDRPRPETASPDVDALALLTGRDDSGAGAGEGRNGAGPVTGELSQDVTTQDGPQARPARRRRGRRGGRGRRKPNRANGTVDATVTPLEREPMVELPPEREG